MKRSWWLLLPLLLPPTKAAPPALVCPDVLAFLPGADAVRMANPAFAQHYCDLVAQTVCRPRPGWLLSTAFSVRMALLPPGHDEGATFFIPWLNRSADLYATLQGSNATYRRWPMMTDNAGPYLNSTEGMVDVIGYLSPPSTIGVFYYPPWRLVLQYPSRMVTGTDGLNCSLYSNETSGVLAVAAAVAKAATTKTTTNATTTTRASAPSPTPAPMLKPMKPLKPLKPETDSLAAIIATAIALPSLALLALALASRYYSAASSSAAYAAVPPVA